MLAFFVFRRNLNNIDQTMMGQRWNTFGKHCQGSKTKFLEQNHHWFTMSYALSLCITKLSGTQWPLLTFLWTQSCLLESMVWCHGFTWAFFFPPHFFALLFFLTHQLFFTHNCPSKGVSGSVNSVAGPQSKKYFESPFRALSGIWASYECRLYAVLFWSRSESLKNNLCSLRVQLWLY